MKVCRLASTALVVSLAVACDDGDDEPSGGATCRPRSVDRRRHHLDVGADDRGHDVLHTVTTTSTTVIIPTTTASTDALEAEIAADYERTFYEQYEMLRAPSLDDLDARVAGARSGFAGGGDIHRAYP